MNIGDMVTHPDYTELHNERGAFVVTDIKMVKRVFSDDYEQARAEDPNDPKVFIVAPASAFTQTG